MNPAQVVIKVFGGVRSLARVLDVSPSTVSRWQERGKVTQKYHERLLDLARRRGRRLTDRDLVRGRAR